jgi:hypothetical protein
MESRENVGFAKEIGAMLEAKVKVSMKSRENYFVVGNLKGFSRTTESLILTNAQDTLNNAYSKIVIHGSEWSTITLESTPFPMEGLFQRLKNVFPPGQVKYVPEAQTISVMGKYSINESGVNGEGPVVDRIKLIYRQYIDEVNK